MKDTRRTQLSDNVLGSKDLGERLLFAFELQFEPDKDLEIQSHAPGSPLDRRESFPSACD